MTSSAPAGKNLNGHPHETKPAPADGSLAASWYCKMSPTSWSAYSVADTVTLETAFKKRDNGTNKLRISVVNGAYVVNLLQLLQYKADDALRQRPVKRLLEKVSTTSTTTTEAATHPAIVVAEDKSTIVVVDADTDTKQQQPTPKKARVEKSPSQKSSPNQSPTKAAKATAASNVANPYSVGGTFVPGGAMAKVSHASSTTKDLTAVAAQTTSSSSIYSRHHQAAVVDDANLTDPNATSIELVRFAKSIFHCIVPTSNAAAMAVHNGKVLSVTLHSAESPSETFTIKADLSYRSQIQMFGRLLKRVPLINRSSLADSAAKCRPNTKEWLKSIGRNSKFGGVWLKLNTPLKDLPANQPVTLTPHFSTTVGHLQKLAARSHFSLVGGSQFQRSGSITDVANPDSVLVVCGSSMKQDALSAREHLEAQLMLLSGPVLMCVDNDFTPVKNPPEFIACSIPGINFAYSDADQKAFLSLVSTTGDTSLGFNINETKAVERMRLIWAHTLAAMDSIHHVQVACLCAIGCGAFKGYFGVKVPLLWGRALALALTHFKEDSRNAGKFIKTSYDISPYQNNNTAANANHKKNPATNCGVFNHLESIIVSLPTFGADNNFAAFSLGLRTCLSDIGKSCGILNLGHLPILLVEDASMTTTASYCAAIEKKRVGILNPSDVQAIRHGWVGMYWDGGHVALEELLAMTTTLLVQHVGLDKELYTNGARRSIVSL